MFDDKLRIAYIKSDKISSQIFYDDNEMVSTQSIIDAVVKNTNCDINIGFRSFKNLNLEFPYGAMMRIELDENDHPKEANIIVNNDNDNRFQRFSMVHELGHLVTESNFLEERLKDKKEYIISTHINYNITNISPKLYEDNIFLLNEQVANIFALRVLMPYEQFKNKILEYNDIYNVARFFGVTEDAIMSRIAIGA